MLENHYAHLSMSPARPEPDDGKKDEAVETENEL